MLDRVKNFASNIIKRCFVTRASDDSGRFQVNQISAMDKITDCEVFTPYGLYSSPPKNSIGILFHPLGDEQLRVAMFNVIDQRFKNLKDNEVQVGNPVTECSIKFDKDGNMIIITPQDIRVTVGVDYSITVENGYSLVATTDATIQAPTINLKGNVVIDGTLTANSGAITMTGGDFNTSGSITATGNVIGQGTSLHTHVHSGVTTGGSDTGAPV